MLFFRLALSLLSAGIASSVFGIIGALVLIGAVLPPFLDTVKSKKTFGIDIRFFLFSALGGLLFFAVAIFLIVGNDVGVKILGGTMIVSNLASVSMNAYMFKIKSHNLKCCQERGMDEEEYYNKHVLPNLNVKNSRPERSSPKK